VCQFGIGLEIAVVVEIPRLPYELTPQPNGAMVLLAMVPEVVATTLLHVVSAPIGRGSRCSCSYYCRLRRPVPSHRVPSERMAKVAVEELYPFGRRDAAHDRLPDLHWAGIIDRIASSRIPAQAHRSRQILMALGIYITVYRNLCPCPCPEPILVRN